MTILTTRTFPKESQSLNTDQGNLDTFNATVPTASVLSSQSLNMDQGNSDSAE